MNMLQGGTNIVGVFDIMMHPEDYNLSLIQESERLF